MKISKYFNIGDDILFEDVDLDNDNKLFIDPYLIYISDDDFSNQCANKIVDYFESLLKYARLGDKGNGYKLVRFLQENNETRLGYSSGIPKGRGLGANKGKELFDLLCKSKAVKTGLVSDIFDASIMIEKVGYDKISDLTTNIILSNLIEFTQEQCRFHSIPMKNVSLNRPVWNSETEKWIKYNDVLLPVYGDKPIVLVPKNFVRPYLVYNCNRYYNVVMLPEYDRFALKNPLYGLIKIVKRGPVPARTKIRKTFPCNKHTVVEHIESHPEIYQQYKKRELNYIANKNV